MLPIPYETVSDNEPLVAHVWNCDREVISSFTQRVFPLDPTRLSTHAICGTIFSGVRGYAYMFGVIESHLTKCLELCFLLVGGSYFTIPFMLHRTNLRVVVCGVCEGFEYHISDSVKYIIEEYIRDTQQSEARPISNYMSRINNACNVVVSLRVFTKVAQYLDEWTRL